MEALRDAWSGLTKDARRGQLDTRELNRAMRRVLERPEDLPTEAVVQWCEEVLASDLSLEEATPLAWQLLFRVDAAKGAKKSTAAIAAAAVSHECSATGDAQNPVKTAWMRVGKYRAMLLSDAPLDSHREVATYLRDVVQTGGVPILLASFILEVACLICEKMGKDGDGDNGDDDDDGGDNGGDNGDGGNGYDGDDDDDDNNNNDDDDDNNSNDDGDGEEEAETCRSLIRVMDELACCREDVIQHKARLLTIALYRCGLDGELRGELDETIISMGIKGKMRYLLLRDLLEANIEVTGLTDPLTLSPLYEILAQNKQLACVVADVIVLFTLRKAYPLIVEVKDVNGFIGIYLFPRIVKRLCSHTTALLEDLKRRNELLLYFALYSAMANGEASPPALDMDMVTRALHDRDETLCNRAFSCLCRAQNIDSRFTDALGTIVEERLVDAQLGSTPEGRQQTVTALQYLVDAHFTRLYKLCRDAKQRSDSASPVEVVGMEAEMEMETIVRFWVGIAQMSITSMSMSGHYNKNDLCLRTLQTILDVWGERLGKCASLTVRGKLQSLFQEIKGQLGDPKIVQRLCRLVSGSSFDTIRDAAGHVLRALEYPETLPFHEDGYFEGVLLPMLASHRAHKIDGAAKLLDVYCDARRDHFKVVERLADRLEEEATKLDADRAGTLASSSALGLIVALQATINRSTPTCALRIAECCRKIGDTATLFVSHPSPEGHYVDEMEEEGEEGETEEDLSFSIMTFCWRAVKEGSILLAQCLAQIKSTDETYLMSNGEYLVNLLLRIRHPGAFMAISCPLRKVCQICFASPNWEVNLVPDKLLMLAVDLCLTQPEIQTTRRSAGLPVCIAAIVSASKDTMKRGKLLSYAIDTLLEATLLKTDALEEAIASNPQIIHTVNILRQLFKDATLAEDIIAYIPTGLRICFQAFPSSSWAVRNSGMMLFTALMNRIFGIRHDTDDFAPGNLVDPRTLHAQCREILPLLAGACRRSAEMLGQADMARYRVEFAVYPLLSCIQRIRFSASGEHLHRAFYQAALELCRQCLGSDIMKVRKMTARLLTHMCTSPMIREEVVVDVERTLWMGTWRNCNRLHGYLLLLAALQEAGLMEGGGDADRRLLGRTKQIVTEAGIRCFIIDAILDNTNVMMTVGMASLSLCHDESVEELASQISTRQIVTEAGIKCFNIDAILDNTNAMMTADMASPSFCHDESVGELASQISTRRMPAEEVAEAVPMLVEYALTHSDDLSRRLCCMFESFWREYDLAGTYRLAVVKSWRPVPCRTTRRMRYLSLTDDDEAIRLLGTGSSFGEPGSVSHILRRLLREHFEDIEDLVAMEPTLAERNFDEGRQRLFEPEPLNGFKDLAWERRVMAQ